MKIIASLLLVATAASAARAAKVPSVSELSVEELVGQTFIVALDTDLAKAREADIRTGRLGGALLRWDRFTGDEAREFSVLLREWSNASPHAVPFWLSTDHEGGPTFTQRRYGLPPFPGNMALGATGSESLTRDAAKATARGLRALGISVTFAPSLDVNSNPANPIIGLRSFGEDPALVSRLGKAALRGYREGGVLAVVKHFPGHGDTSDDSHLGLPVSTKTLSALERVELAPFRAAFKDGAEGAMPAHMVFAALGTSTSTPVTLSSAAVEGFLRGKLSFSGLVFTDSLDMGAIANVYGSSEAAVMSLLAGDDVLLLGKGDFPSSFAAVVDAVNTGRLPRARLESSVARILEAKRRLGLFEEPPIRPLPLAERAKDHRLARVVADSAVTLVRNDGLLPLRLREDQTLGVVLFHSWRYNEEASRFVLALSSRHARVEVLDFATVSPSTAAVDDAARRLKGAAAVVVGTYQYGTPISAAQVALLRRLAVSRTPVAAVSLMNPYDLAASTSAAAAICVYGMTDSSLDAATRLLFGAIKPRGRLPVSVPGVASAGDGLR
jgi:beta-N-acetylhexosaminidase